MLDSQAIVGMAGGEVGKLVFYNAVSMAISDIGLAYDQAVTDNNVKIINVSLGLCEPHMSPSAMQQQDVAAGDLVTDKGNNASAATAVLTVGNGSNTPAITVAPGSLDFSLAAGASSSQNLTLANAGGDSLSYSFFEADYNLQPLDSYSFVVDDGSIDGADALSDGNQTAEYAAVWLNRFTVLGPVSINQISIYWPSQTDAGGDLTGQQPTLLVYYDADGDGNPANATPLYSALVSISNQGAFEYYSVNVAVPGAGDIYVGFSDSWANGGASFYRAPAAADTSTPQNRSYILYNGDGSAPNLGDLSQNGSTAGLDYNLMIRASASSNYSSSNCSSPQSIGWLTATPGSGAVIGGHDVTVAIAADATSLAAGNYAALLCVASNDTNSNVVVVPVSLTVTGAPPNQPPVARFSFVATDLDVNFTDTSTDSDGSIASWSWDFGDSGTSSSQNPSHSYAAGGTYTVQLTVTDDDGASHSTSQQVTVSLINLPPTATFTYVATGLTVSFIDSSIDPDGSIAS